jgi:hypothetical protein
VVVGQKRLATPMSQAGKQLKLENGIHDLEENS